MSERFVYEYAVLRVIPRPDLGEGINAGVILFCPERKFLRAAVDLDEERLKSLAPGSSVPLVQTHLRSASKVCDGGEVAGLLGELSQRERFGRVVAPRSGIVQPSEVHTGLTADPERTLERLLTLLTRSGSKVF